jgi:hypothetical protein
MSNVLNEGQRAKWKEYRKALLTSLFKEVQATGAEKNLLQKGITRAVDERYATAASKLSAMENKESLTLETLASGAGGVSKADLLGQVNAKAFSLAARIGQENPELSSKVQKLALAGAQGKKEDLQEILQSLEEIEAELS